MGTAFLFGTIGGCFIVSWCHQLTAVLGLSLTTTTAAALSLAIGIQLAWRRPRPHVSGGEAPLGAFALLCLVPAAWSIGFVWLMQMANALVGQFSVETLAAPGPRLLLSFAIAFVAITLPVYAITRLPIQLVNLWPCQSDGSKSGNRLHSVYVPFLLGMAAGILGDVLLLAPFVGLQTVSYAAAVCTTGLFVLAWKNTSIPTAVEQTSTPTLQPQRRRHSIASHADSLWAASIVVCLGGLAAIATRLTHQLMPTVGFLVWTKWAAVLFTAAMGMLWSARCLRTQASAQKPGILKKPGFSNVTSSRTTLRCGAALLAAGWCGVLPLLFSWHVEGMLLLNSYVSSVWLQVVLRCLIVCSMLAPFGFAWGMLAAAPQRQAKDESVGSFPQLLLFSFIAGLLAVRWLLLPRWPLENLLPFVSIVLAGLALFRWLVTRELPSGRLARASIASLLCLAALSPFVRQQYNPAESARLLFSTQVFLAKRSGLQGQLLPYIDEGRLVARQEGEHGTYTLWSMRGTQLQLRESGIPKAIVSNNTRICPQFSADVMQAALPLVLHENPRRTLLLGLQGGVTLDTCFHFPLRQLTCVESDPALIRLVKDKILTAEKRDLFADGRVRMLPLDPTLALAADDEPYDVIISSPDQPALAQSTPYYTLEFYRNAANKLTDDGIFCQRFQYVDFGPEPLRVVTATLQKAFSTVTAIETASGELALVATNSQKGLMREGLMARLEANHVRNVLGQLGWDWVVPLNLSAYHPTTLKNFVAETDADSNTAANGHLAHRLPLEVMRWGAKWEEIRDVLSSRTGSLLKWNTRDDASDALLRLEEISGQRNLITRYPDRKWAYRKTLRERMKTKSRTVIQQVKGEGPKRKLHPDDKRRKEYFSALGTAVKTPNATNIQHIAEFSHPYDPLVSFFLHDEIVRLYDRTEHPDPQAELEHRLYLVYYSDPRDRSVRNIVAALNLLVDHPQAVPNALARRDHLDALLQMLKSRWHGRGAGAPIFKNIALNDVAESVSATAAAFAAMEKLYTDNNLDTDKWHARKRVLERALLRPLRTYRTQLLAQQPKPTGMPTAGKQSNAN
jgi:spermidine synthase